MKVFLGGTAMKPDYREELIPMLKCDYFNPIVDDWDESCRLEEEYQKKICDTHLYVITGKQDGYYSFTEIGVDSVKLGRNMILCILKDQFSQSKQKSLEAIENLCRENGSVICDNLESVSRILNDRYVEARIFDLRLQLESAVGSKLDKEYVKQGKKNLNRFRKKIIDQSIINQYSKTTKLLKQVDLSVDKKVAFFDNNKLVCFVTVTKDADDLNWIDEFEITKEYQGYGLSKQLLNFAVKKLHAQALDVSPDNEIAIKVYQDYGFRASKISIERVKKKEYCSYQMYYKNPLNLELVELKV